MSASKSRFKDFTDHANKVMVLSWQQTHRFNHHSTETEHLLLALIIEGCGKGAMALRNLGLDQYKLRRDVEQLMRPGSAVDDGICRKPPFSPAIERVIEFAINESNNLGHGHVGTEHLLLGLLAEKEAIAAQTLAAAGVTAEKLKTEISRLLATPPTA